MFLSISLYFGVRVYPCPSEELEKDVEFEVVGEVPEKGPGPSSASAPAAEDGKSITNGNKDSAQPSTSSKGQHYITECFV